MTHVCSSVLPLPLPLSAQWVCSCGAVTSQVGDAGNSRAQQGASAEPASLRRDQGLDVWVPRFPAALSEWGEGLRFQGPWRS